VERNPTRGIDRTLLQIEGANVDPGEVISPTTLTKIPCSEALAGIRREAKIAQGRNDIME
jgi:hypothetical protein